MKSTAADIAATILKLRRVDAGEGWKWIEALPKSNLNG